MKRALALAALGGGFLGWALLSSGQSPPETTFLGLPAGSEVALAEEVPVLAEPGQLVREPIPEAAEDRHPPEIFWKLLLDEISLVLDRHGDGALRGGLGSPLELVVSQLEGNAAPPRRLPAPSWVLSRSTGRPRAVMVALAARRFPDGFESWADTLVALGGPDSFLLMGLLYASMESPMGGINPARVHRFQPGWAFLENRLGECRWEGAQGWARKVLQGGPLRGWHAFTVRSLAALVVAQRYEAEASARRALERALLLKEPWDPAAFPGAILGLSEWGGPQAAQVIATLMQRPELPGKAMVWAWAGHLLPRGAVDSASWLDAGRDSPSGALALTLTGMDVIRAGGEDSFFVLSKLMQRALDPMDQGIDRHALLFRMLSGDDPEAGCLLAEELAWQHPRWLVHLPQVARVWLENPALAPGFPGTVGGLKEHWRGESVAQSRLAAVQAILERGRGE